LTVKLHASVYKLLSVALKY